MTVLNMTSAKEFVDSQCRPYFLWDMDLSLDAFQAALQDRDPQKRSYLVGKLMRQGKPDDVFAFVT